MANQEGKIDLRACYRPTEQVIGRRVMDEYILVPLARDAADLDALFRLNPVGAFIWERFDGQTAGAEIIRQLAEEFDVLERQAAEDYRAFVARLLSVQVLAHSENPAS